MKTGRRHIQTGEQFNKLFPPSKGTVILLKKGNASTVNDTLPAMQRIIRETLWQTKKIAPLLQGETIYKTCENVWDFVFHHFQYKRDKKGKEQLRHPATSWDDRHDQQGVDCDDVTILIASILLNLGITPTLRIARYKEPKWEHIYVVVKTQTETITLDAVVHGFNHEVPYSAKRDTIMDLEELAGVDSAMDRQMLQRYAELPVDAEQIMLEDEELGFLKKWREKRKAKKAQNKAEGKRPVRDFFKKAAHVVNRVNPATALLRAGVLASMKLNVMNVAAKLRFAYWSDEHAQQNNMDMGKFNQLKRIREKLEKIFHGAGGKTYNLRKAIITGKGNQDRRVVLNGLGSVIEFVSEHDSLENILGEEIYRDEFAEFEQESGLSLAGLGDLGEPTTTAAVGAASSVIGTIAALLKKLGNLFKKGSRQAAQETQQENDAKQEEKTRKFSLKNIFARLKDKRDKIPAELETLKKMPMLSALLPTPTPDAVMPPSNSESSEITDAFTRSATANQTTDQDNSSQPEPTGVMGWIKANPGKTAMIAVGSIGLIGLGVYYYRKKQGLAGVAGKASKGSKKKKASSTGRKQKRKPTSRKGKPTRKRKTTKKRSTNKISYRKLSD